MILEQVTKSLVEACQVDRRGTLLVAVSGGADSLCLMHVLRRLGYPIVVAHLDHQLRPESAQEASTLARQCQESGIPFVLGQENVEEFCRAEKFSLEEGARILRYQFLFRQAQTCQAQAVVTGHTADDQVETVLMHLLRGSGLSGLCGMAFRSLPNAWSSSIPLIRPLLGAWKQEILDYIQENNLAPNEDASNRDLRFQRNRVRHELLPLAETYSPGFRRRVWQMARVLSEDEALLELTTDRTWDLCVETETADWLAFKLPVFLTQPQALQNRLLRRAVHHLQPGYADLDFPAIQRASHFVREPGQGKQIEWIGGLSLSIDDQRLLIAPAAAMLNVDFSEAWPKLDCDAPLAIPIPGNLTLADGWELIVEVIPDLQLALSQAVINPDPYTAWITGEVMASGLRTRQPQPGDRISPLGMAGHSIKISDLMVNEKIPHRARAKWPLIVCQNDLVWVPGLRVAELFRLQTYSHSALCLKLRRTINPL
jgi:tRNA(Ile)-lysidine synthase